MENLHVIIGLEMHCELKSNSKVFSTGANTYSNAANTNVSPVDMAFPGVLPIVNKKCVEHAIKMAHILNCDIAKTLIFDRKNYYYPDLPKGYQITQVTRPIGINGHINYFSDGEIKQADIYDIHLEEDSASLDHLGNTSTIDYNRAGVPLLELVTKPCFTSASDAVNFVENMIKIYQYSDISDADTKRGQIRCDVNVNLQNEKGEYVTPRVEVKNVNSLSNIYKAIKYEEKRQLNAYNSNAVDELSQETRRYDEETDTTIRMRKKEDAIDYKYFIEPNILPFKISEEYKDKLIKEIPVLPLDRKIKYTNKLNIKEEDANTLIRSREISDYFEECLNQNIDAQTAANWVCVNILGYINSNNLTISSLNFKVEYLKQIIDNLNKGNISSKQAKEIFVKSIEENKEPIEFMKDNVQISDEEYLNEIIDNIIANNQAQKESYLNGRTNLFDYFVGQVMKETRGKANPNVTKELLKNKLK